MKKIFLLIFLLSSLGYAQAQPSTITIPLAGNAYYNADKAALASHFDSYFYVHQNVVADIYTTLALPQNAPKTFKVKFQNREITVSSSAFKGDSVRLWKQVKLEPGYQKIQFSAVNQQALPPFLALKIQAKGLVESNFAYVKNPKDFYFGRRGPSVHLRYIPADAIKDSIQYFYTEVTVSKGMDPVGSYFQADGFSFGYFGIQVNSEKERRVLFSVWSPFTTDNPKEIPDSLRIEVLKVGENVHHGAFGDEGSGGQTYLEYPWKAEQTYGFLLKAMPDKAKHSMIYAAYFKDFEHGKWQLIAQMRRPTTQQYLAQFYSFVENFIPEKGNISRKAKFQNQWFGTVNGQWYQPTHAQFTTDATGNAGIRKDYKGGIENESYYLQMGGFFDDYSTPKTILKPIKSPHFPDVAGIEDGNIK